MIGDTEIWLVIAGLGVLTYAIRFSFLGLLAGRTLQPTVARALGFVPVTVLPAIVAPMLVLEDGAFALQPAKLIAAGLVVAACRTGLGLLPSVLAGIAGYLALGAIGL